MCWIYTANSHKRLVIGEPIYVSCNAQLLTEFTSYVTTVKKVRTRNKGAYAIKVYETRLITAHNSGDIPMTGYYEFLLISPGCSSVVLLSRREMRLRSYLNGIECHLTSLPFNIAMRAKDNKAINEHECTIKHVYVPFKRYSDNHCLDYVLKGCQRSLQTMRYEENDVHSGDTMRRSEYYHCRGTRRP